MSEPGGPDADDMAADDKVRARQKSRALIMALLLGAFVVLMFAITIAKMSVNQ